MTQQTITIPVGDPAAVKEGRANAVEMTAMQSMASKMWRPLLLMGLTIVVASFVIAIFNGLNLGDFFGDTKAVREATPNHENIGTVMAVQTWLPGFKILGVGLMLGGITFVLATILGNLRVAGANLQASLGSEVKLPKPPMIARLFPIMMMMGIMTLLGTLFIGAWLATVAGDVYGNAIADVNAAGRGTSLLADQGTVHAVKAWLTPMEFLGLAFLFSAITLALGTIVGVLRFQARRLLEIAREKSPA